MSLSCCCRSLWAERKQTERRKFAVSLWKRCNEQAVPHDLKIIRVSVSSFLCKVAVFQGGSLGRLDRDGGSDQLRQSAATKRIRLAARGRSIIPHFWDTFNYYQTGYLFRLCCSRTNCFGALWAAIPAARGHLFLCFPNLSHQDWNRTATHADLGISDMKREDGRVSVWKEAGNKSEHTIVLFHSR